MDTTCRVLCCVGLIGASTAQAEPHSSTEGPDILTVFLSMPGDATGRAAVLETRDLTDAEAIAQGHSARAEVNLERDRVAVRSLGDGEGWTTLVQRYASNEGEAVILAVQSQWGMCGTQSTVQVWTVADLHFTEVTAARWPILSWDDFHEHTGIVEEHGRAPVYGVGVGEDGAIRISLDGCQLEYDDLSFAPTPPAWTRRERRIGWDGQRFTVQP